MIALQSNGLVALNNRPIAIAWDKDPNGWWATSCNGDYLHATTEQELKEDIQKLINETI